MRRGKERRGKGSGERKCKNQKKTLQKTEEKEKAMEEQIIEQGMGKHWNKMVRQKNYNLDKKR